MPAAATGYRCGRGHGIGQLSAVESQIWRFQCVWEKKGTACGGVVACPGYHGNDNIGIMMACVRKAQVMYATVLQIATVPCVSICSGMTLYPDSNTTG